MVTINDEIIVAGLMHPICVVIEYNDVYCVLDSAGSLATTARISLNSGDTTVELD